MLKWLLVLAVVAVLVLLVRRASRSSPADPSATAAMRRTQVTRSAAAERTAVRPYRDGDRSVGPP